MNKIKKNIMLVTVISIVVVAVVIAASWNASSDVSIGKSAPVFSLNNQEGKTVGLEDFKGKVLVLEWTNPNCPFVVGHYENGNMTGLQKKYRKKDVEWVLVNSTNTSHRDFMTGKELEKKFASWGADYSHILLDEKGIVGKAYGAKTTPHMFVIDKKGSIVYAGAIDDDRSTSGGKDAKVNYVAEALDEILKGDTVSTTSTSPYGCSVKY